MISSSLCWTCCCARRLSKPQHEFSEATNSSKRPSSTRRKQGSCVPSVPCDVLHLFDVAGFYCPWSTRAGKSGAASRSWWWCCCVSSRACLGALPRGCDPELGAFSCCIQVSNFLSFWLVRFLWQTSHLTDGPHPTANPSACSPSARLRCNAACFALATLAIAGGFRLYLRLCAATARPACPG